MAAVRSERLNWMARLRTGPFWLVLWSAPLWASIAPRILRHKTSWLVDFKSVVCASERWNAHRTLYSATAQCGDPRNASPFVYPPWIAHLFSYPVGWVGGVVVLAGYAIVFVAALVLLFWLIFWRPIGGMDRSRRTPFLGLTSGNLVFVGNIAVLMQALIAAAAIFLGADTIACAAAILVTGLVKPIYLTFLTLPAFSSAGWLRRAGLVLIPALVVAALCLSHMPLVTEWRAFILQVAVDDHPGGGLLGWLGQAGVTSRPVLAASYAIYAALLFGAGLVIAETAKLGSTQRVWLALSVGVLLLPRIMAYDLLIVGPGLLVASQAASTLSVRAADRVSALWLGACGLYLVSSLLGGVFQIGHAVALAAIPAGLIGIGFVMAAGLLRARSGAAPLVQTPPA